jgi:uncharacterized protein
MKSIFPVVICLLVFVMNTFVSAQETTDSLPPGYKKFYFPDGKVSSEGILREGKPDGYWKNYNIYGKLKSEGNRINFQLEGIWKFYDEEGNVVLETNYSNGKKEGIRITRTPEERIEEYFEDDQKQGIASYFDKEGFLIKTIPYENGRENGIMKIYNRDSVVITMAEYRRGLMISREYINRYDASNQPTGLWRTFYNDGNVNEEFTYKFGKLDGYFKKYDREGNLESIRKYNNGELLPDSDELVEYEIRRDYYPDMKVKIEGSYRDGVPDGVRKEFNPDGSLSVVYLIDKGKITGSGILDDIGKKQGFWKEYYLEGGIKAEGSYAGGIPVGNWVYYFQDGTIEQKGGFDNKGREQGKWLWYYPGGVLRREEDFSAGIRNGSMKEYDEKGNLIASGDFVDGEEDGEWFYQEEGYRQEGTYAEGERDGEWIHHYPDGTISFSGKYIDGYPDGKHIWFNPDGTTRTEGDYIMGIRHGLWKYYTETGVLILLVEFKNGIEVKYDNVVIKPQIPGSDM